MNPLKANGWLQFLYEPLSTFSDRDLTDIENDYLFLSRIYKLVAYINVNASTQQL